MTTQNTNVTGSGKTDDCAYHDYFLSSEKRKLKEGYRNPTGFRRRVKVAGSGGLCYTCVMGTWKSKNRHKYLELLLSQLMWNY